MEVRISAYAAARLRLAQAVAGWHPSAKLHGYLHTGEHWAHRIYLALVGVEVKYWYGKVALVILVIELVVLALHENE